MHDFQVKIILNTVSLKIRIMIKYVRKNCKKLLLQDAYYRSVLHPPTAKQCQTQMHMFQSYACGNCETGSYFTL
jgi:hypothetical protein